MAEPIHPPTMRARLILDVANELAIASPFRHVHVSFPDAVEPLVLSNASTPDAIAEVVSGETTLAILNPSAALTVAYRGHGPFAARRKRADCRGDAVLRPARLRPPAAVRRGVVRRSGGGAQR